MSRKDTPLFATALLIAALAGCGGPKEEETFVIPTGMVEVDSDGATITTDDATAKVTPDGATITTADGATASTGDLATFPDDTPEDLPRHPVMKVHAVTAQGDTITYQAETQLGPAATFEWYKNDAAKKGWEETDSMEQPGFSMVGFKKGPATLSVNVMAGEPGTGTGTVVNVTYSKS